MIQVLSKIPSVGMNSRKSSQKDTLIFNEKIGAKNSINLNNSPQNHYNKSLVSFRSNIIKTLPEIVPSAENFRYFYNNYPLLAKHVGQGEYSIVKYTGKESERYITTTGCHPCSKLTMYDPDSKIGFLSHLGHGDILVNSSKIIKEGLQAVGADLRKLQVRHIGGEDTTPKYKIKSVYILMKNLGLKSAQLIEEDVAPYMNRKDGIILDLYNGQTYSLTRPYSLFLNYDKMSLMGELKKRFNIEENAKLVNEAERMLQHKSMTEEDFEKKVIKAPFYTKV